MMTGPYLTTREVAELLRINPATVRVLIQEGILEAAMLGREYRVPPRAIEALHNRRPGPPRPRYKAHG